jgi:hypothetical protein
VNDDLIAALIAERFGPAPNRERSQRSERAGNADTELVQARRRRELCKALNDAPRQRAGRLGLEAA